MINCTYCNAAIDRKVFCSNSHKVMYHTKGKLKDIKEAMPSLIPNDAPNKEDTIVKDVLEDVPIVPKDTTIIPSHTPDIPTPGLFQGPKDLFPDLCPHGTKRYCKFKCT
uniref:Uncharacterized protein n=1 Tax=viral metagenome TaxID=1070528 RepID=A0A6M3J2M5_9ZZZZ